MIAHTLTDQIAFDLGEFKFPSFYSSALWKINKEPFPYLHFFNWGMSWGTPCSSEPPYETNWKGFDLYGSLKTDKIKELRHKLAYIRGTMRNYSFHKESETKISWHFANSYDIRDFVSGCLYDLINFGFNPRRFGPGLRKGSSFTIKKGETLGTIPGTPYVILEADKEIIDWLIGGEDPLDIHFIEGSVESERVK